MVAVCPGLLARLWAAGAGRADVGGPSTLDLDSSIVPVHGRGKQDAAFGYTNVRDYAPKFATCAETGWCCSADSVAGQLVRPGVRIRS
jgi:hypothetical protein